MTVEVSPREKPASPATGSGRLTHTSTSAPMVASCSRALQINVVTGQNRQFAASTPAARTPSALQMNTARGR